MVEYNLIDLKGCKNGHPLGFSLKGKNDVNMIKESPILIMLPD